MMNISLSEPLKAFVDQQVSGRGFDTDSDYVRDLIHKDQDRQNLRQRLLDGAASEPTQAVDDIYFADLRERVKQGQAG